MSDTATQPVFEVKVPAPAMTKGEREYRAFLNLLPKLLVTYAGKFVAIHQEQVVDSDTNDIVLIQRVHGKIGYVPIYVGLVSEHPHLVRIPHYREFRPAGAVQ